MQCLRYASTDISLAATFCVIVSGRKSGQRNCKNNFLGWCCGRNNPNRCLDSALEFINLGLGEPDAGDTACAVTKVKRIAARILPINRNRNLLGQQGLERNDKSCAGDGLSTFAEYEGGTDPCAADTDGDGYKDGFDANPLIEDPPEGNIPLLPLWATSLLIAFLLLAAHRKTKAHD